MLREFRGKPFFLEHMNCCKGTWIDQYSAVIAQYAECRFVTVYSTQEKQIRTYAQFDLDVRKVLFLLRAHYSRATSVVTISENGYALLVVQMAALLSSKTLCPMNPAEGQARLQQKIAQLGGEPMIFCFHDGLAFSSNCETRLPDGPVADLDLKAGQNLGRIAVEVFTSGTTGYAKIVQLTEANLLANVDALIEHHRLDPTSVVCTPLPLFHVNALGFSFLSSFAAGAQFVLLQNAQIHTIFHAIEEEGVKILSVIPPLLRALILRGKGPELRKLQYVVSAAAPLSCQLAEQFFQRFAVPVVQGYGLSEAVNFSLTLPLDLPLEDYKQWMFRGRFPSVGIELSGNTVAVLAPDGSECGAEVEGRIGIRGWSVMSGYKGESTTAFAGGFLQTGDLGYFQTDPQSGRKFFFISGRNKDVVKRAGETVSLREVDDLVASFQIAGLDAIAVSFPNDLVGEQVGLVCRIGARDEQGRWRDELLRQVQNAMPTIVRPIVMLETERELRTASGKPMRWIFSELFAKFQGASLGPLPIWGDV